MNKVLIRISPIILVTVVFFSFSPSVLGETLTEMKLSSSMYNQFLPQNHTAKMTKMIDNLIANSPEDTPSSTVINAVKQDISNRFNINKNEIQVKETIKKNWNDGCLGLGKPDEFCTQAIVEGWQITLKNNNKTWVYRTNNNGSVIRLEL